MSQQPLPNPLIGFRSLLHKEVARFWRVVGQTVLNPLISSSLYLLIFGVNLADRIEPQNGVNYLQFIVPGLLAMGVLNNSFQNASSSVITSKFHGDFQDLRIVPLQPAQIVWAYACAATLRGAMVGCGVGIVGQIFHLIKYGTLISIAHPFLLLLFIALSGATFGFIGLTIAIYARSFDQVSAVSTFVILPLIYLGGVFFSIERMPVFWEVVSHFNPLLYLINGIRYSVLDVSDIGLGVSLPLALVFLGLGFMLASVAVRRGSYMKF